MRVNLLQKIKYKALLLTQILFTLLAFFLMVILSYYFASDIVRDSLVRNAESVFNFAQTRIESDLLEPRMILGSFAQSIQGMLLRGDDMESIQHHVDDMTSYIQISGSRMKNEDLLHVYIEALPGGHELPDGPVFMTSKQWAKPDNYEPTQRPWYKAALAAGGDIAETAPFESVIAGGTVISFARCIFDHQGNRLGVISLNMSIGAIGNEVVGIALNQGGYGLVFSQDAVLIAHANPSFLGMHIRDPDLPIHIYADEILAGIDISDRPFTNWLGEDTMVFIRELPNGWYLGLLTPRNEFYNSLTNMMTLLCILGASLSAVLILILVRIDIAKSKSDEESRQKSAFLANMSHEIRTPLNAILGLSELVLDAVEPNTESHNRIEQIYGAGATLLNTVNDILDISKIEAGRFELNQTPYDTPSMINDAVTQSIVFRGSKPIEFIMNISEDLPSQLFGDELRIKQILSNLLSNSFKYTQKGTVELTMSCAREGEAVCLTASVRDTGIGIKPEDTESLFEDYTQIDRGANRKIMGTGLGLPIVKRMVEFMGGNVLMESEYGKGSVFTVHIPQRHVSDNAIGQETIENLKYFHYSEFKRRRDSNLPRLRLPYAKVLVVDDLTTNLEIAKGLMKPYEMQIDCVTGGREAIEAIRSEDILYNAVFMDHMMPGMDGVEATRLIREIDTEYARNIPIIALTANAIVGNEEMFLNKGFQAFISKPIEIARLDSVIREWVRDKSREDNTKHPDEQGASETVTRYDIDWAAFDGKAPGLSIEQGVKRFGGNAGDYINVLRAYADSTPPLLEAAQGVTREHLKEYATTVHGIKGASRGIYAYETADMAETLEMAAKAGNYAYVQANNAAFLESARMLLSGIDEMLEQIDEENPRRRKSAPDEEALSKLCTACKAYDMDGVDAAISELEAFEYESDGELVAWLKESVEQMNFSEIVERLDDLNGQE